MSRLKSLMETYNNEDSIKRIVDILIRFVGKKL